MTSENKPRKIFESYGHKDTEDLARIIKDSLKEFGYDVFFDRDYLDPTDEHFSSMLEEAIQKHQIVVALLSPHSVRLEGDIATASRMSVCHNELIMAVKIDKPVIPVTVIECDPPLAINHYDPIDFTNWRSSPEAYRTGIQDILRWIEESLADPPRRRYRAYVANLPGARLSFPEELNAENDFVGRDWLIDRIEAWFEGEGRCFLVEAEPGAGKTALVAELVRRNRGGRILAYHFCSVQREGTTDARRFVRSLAGMLIGTVPEYRQRLRNGEDLVRALTGDNPASTMLWQGVLEPLRGIEGGARCIVVDALDEAADRPENSILRLLAGALEEFPPWLKLVATTRRDPQVLALFQGAERCFLGASLTAQQQDLRHYIDRRVSDPQLRTALGPDEAGCLRAIETIAERCAGNFQYAAMVLDELRGGRLGLGEIDRLPAGLARLYYQLASRRLPTAGDFEQANRVLGVLFAARQPLTQEQLVLIAGLDRYRLFETLGRLSCFVTWDSGAGDERFYRVAHKSIGDWFANPPPEAGLFRIDPARGRELILRHCRGWAAHRERYALTHLIAHLLEAGLTADALAAVRGGLFEARRGPLDPPIDPACDLDDTSELVLALVRARDEPAVLELAKTANIWQRNGVAAALQAAGMADHDFIDRIVAALLEAKS